MELILTRKTINAQEALDIGLLSKVVPEGKSLESAIEMMKIILSKAPISVKMCIEAVYRGLNMTLAETGSPTIEQVRVRVLPDGRMTRKDAAKYLGRAEKTLAMWEMERKGPSSVLVGGRRFYFKDTLDAFIRGEAA